MIKNISPGDVLQTTNGLAFVNCVVKSMLTINKYVWNFVMDIEPIYGDSLDIIINSIPSITLTSEPNPS